MLLFAGARRACDRCGRGSGYVPFCLSSTYIYGDVLIGSMCVCRAVLVGVFNVYVKCRERLGLRHWKPHHTPRALAGDLPGFLTLCALA